MAGIMQSILLLRAKQSVPAAAPRRRAARPGESLRPSGPLCRPGDPDDQTWPAVKS